LNRVAREQKEAAVEGGGDTRSGVAIRAVIVIAALAGLGWMAPVLGLVAPTSVAVGILALAPIACGWSPQVQVLVGVGAVAAYVWCIPTYAALPERLPSLLLALGGGLVVSLVSAFMVENLRAAERVQRKRTSQRIQEALSGLEIRAGVGSLTRHGAGTDDDDPVAMIERIAVELGRARVEQRKEILHEREQNAHFIGQAAHEFRTPLAVIQTAAEALKLYSGRMSSHQQHVRLVKIEDSVGQMTDLLRNALTFSRADAGKVKVERQAVDLRALAQEVGRDIQQNFGEHEIIVNVRGAARLPQLDQSLAREILINLLTNAAKYSPEGGQIEVEVFTGSTEVRIRVTDHGIGISPADQEHVFEAFRRGANVGDIPGTGLGLAITKRAVESHGGTITFESKVGAGTTFTVTLPERIEARDPLLARRAG
jgi:signal transduction histidine kinase